MAGTEHADHDKVWDLMEKISGTVVSYAKMATAALTGSRPDNDENHRVSM